MKSLSLSIILLVFLVASAQVPNPSFENWTNLLPDNWITNSCPLCDPPFETYIVRQDSDAYSGIYNADLYANGVYKPYAYTTFPVSSHPLKMSFRTKVSFAPCVNDSGFSQQDTVMAKVELLHNGAVVDSGYWSYSGHNISTYQLVEVPLSLNATAFDSCRVYFEGGKVFGGCGAIAEATRFKVDDVTIQLSSGCEAGFYFSKYLDTVYFSEFNNLDSVTGRVWDFDDGNIGRLENPVHIFLVDGWYHVCLTATGFDSSGTNCSSTFCDSILITHDCIDTSLICPPPSLCCDAPLYQPVCGCDNVTYDNVCQATLWYGVTHYTDGPCTTSLNEIKRAAKISLVPNPANVKTELRVEINDKGTLEVRVKNVLGESIGESNSVLLNHIAYTTEIDLQRLTPGIYFVEIRMNKKVVAVKKLVKQ